MANENILAAAVIQKAFSDLKIAGERENAMRFIRSENLEFWASFINLNPEIFCDAAKNIYRREKALWESKLLSLEAK